VLSTAYDRTLGGRNFDRALADHFAKVFQDKYKIDVKSNMKAWIRLEVSSPSLSLLDGKAFRIR
jgi:heat shock protein 4